MRLMISSVDSPRNALRAAAHARCDSPLACVDLLTNAQRAFRVAKDQAGEDFTKTSFCEFLSFNGPDCFGVCLAKCSRRDEWTPDLIKQCVLFQWCLDCGPVDITDLDVASSHAFDVRGLLMEMPGINESLKLAISKN